MTTDRTVTLIGVDGTREVLACPGGPYELGTNAALWGSSPAAVVAERLAGLPGETVQSVNTLPRRLGVPIVIVEDTDGEVDARIDSLVRILRPDQECRIVHDRPGVSREIIARYLTGAESLVQAEGDLGTIRADLQFVAHDPFWRSTVSPISQYGPEPFANGLFALLNEFTIDCQSGVETWPEFTITGVIENAEAMNMRTGQSWRMTERMLDPADEMVIRFDPRGEIGCYLNGAGRQWFLDPDSEPWPLLPGANPIVVRGIDVAQAGNIGTFEMRWVELFDTC